MIPYFEIPPFHIGPLVIQPFGMMVCIAIVMAAVLAERRARVVGLDPHVMRQFVRLSAFFGILGAHVVDVVSDPGKLARDPWSIFKFWSGFSSGGGIVSAVLAWAIYSWRKGIPQLPYLDAMMFGFFPGAVLFARLGCSLVHDHPGRLTHFFLAVQYPGGTRHDLGFYEFLLSLLLSPLVYWLGRKQRLDDPPRGSIFAGMMIAYAGPRFFLDFLRATDLPGSDARYCGLTLAQYFCVVVFVLSAGFFVRQRLAR